MRNLAAQNIKLRRQLRQEREQTKAVLSKELERADYDKWVATVNARIAAINKAIRAQH